MTTSRLSTGLIVSLVTALVLLAGAAGTAAQATGGPAAQPSSACSGVNHSPSCGVTAQPDAGRFHGLIAVPGDDWVFSKAAHAGTQPGCGDCVWSVVLACPEATPENPGATPACVSSGTSPLCVPGQYLFRLYLTTDAAANLLEGTICMGGGIEPIPISDRVQQDLQRYLRNARPPALDVTTRPRTATLAGLRTFFAALPPAGLQPTALTGAGILETITLAPVDVQWQWGDGDDTGWVAAGVTSAHTYRSRGLARATLTARWGATYTVTYQGVTAGPYDARGQLTARQPVLLPIRTSSPTLVSH